MAFLFQFHYTPTIWPLLLSAVLLLVAAVPVWRQRHHPAALAFAAVIAALLIWTIGFALELAAVALNSKLFWANIQFFGISTLPVAWLAMLLAYTGRWPRLKFLVRPLVVIPLATFLVIWTNPWHHLFRGQPVLQVLPSGMAVVDPDYGPWYYWVHAAFSYGVIVLSILGLLRSLIYSQDAYRRQIQLLFIATLFPLVTDGLYNLDLTPIPFFNLTPIAFSISALILTWSMIRFRFLDLLPVARDALVENMEDAWLVVDGLGRLADLNPAAGELIGRPSTEALGLPADVLLADHPALLAQLQQPDETHADLLLGNGDQEQCYDVRVKPIHNRQGRRSGQLMVLRDVSTRQQMKKALQEANIRLREEIAAREQLIQDLDAFARTVAHDLKNPLSAITMTAEMLASDWSLLDPREMGDMAASLYQSTRRMEGIINELLSLATVGAGAIETEPIPMGPVVEQVEERLALLIREHQAVIDRPAHWPLANGHASLLEEVWVNYFSNAIKYGGRPPHLELSATPLDNQMIRFSVRDNGDGLDDKEQAMLFTEFQRLGQRRAAGHGLGLSIAKRIVEKLGGTVGVESKNRPGEGCTFWFTLPAEQLPPGHA